MPSIDENVLLMGVILAAITGVGGWVVFRFTSWGQT